jgi:predicted HicB family RNase H-like nuclease
MRKEERRDHRLSVWMEGWLHERLSKQAEAEELTLSAFVHQKLLEWAEEEDEE